MGQYLLILLLYTNEEWSEEQKCIVDEPEILQISSFSD